MKIDDRVYGEWEIQEGVLLDLINCKSVQRLEGLAQYGLPNQYYHKKGFSRLEHSIGVMIFLRKFNARIEEQIAGLIHDVSHTAFSHVVDWAIGDPEKEDFQDKNHINVIENSEIPKILEHYGFGYADVIDLEKFSLLEKHAPSLCGDRIDYTLREVATDGEGEIAKRLFYFLRTRNGDLFFDNVEVAEEFGKMYSNLNKNHWAGVEARTRYYLLANILKIGFDKNFISYSDLYRTDLELINLLYSSRDKQIIEELDFLKNKKIAKQSDNGKGIYLRKKYRWIDPEVLEDGKIKRLSELSPDYKLFLKEEKFFLESNSYSEVLK